MHSECKIIFECYSQINSQSVVWKLNLSSGTHPLSMTSTLAEIIWAWGVEELLVSGENTNEF